MKEINRHIFTTKLDLKNPFALRDWGYLVAHECDNDIIKIVKFTGQFGGGLYESPVNESILQIQKVGLDSGMESIKFLEGIPFVYLSQPIMGAPLVKVTKYLSTLEDHLTNECLEKFGKEFRPLFEKDSNLRKRISTHFSSLAPYLK